MLYLGKEVCMAKFVPFIIKTRRQSEYQCENRAHEKRLMRYRLKKNPSGKQAGCQIIFRMMPLKSMP